MTHKIPFELMFWSVTQLTQGYDDDSLKDENWLLEMHRNLLMSFQ